MNPSLFAPHEEPELQRVATALVATWPVGTFVENILFLARRAAWYDAPIRRSFVRTNPASHLVLCTRCVATARSSTGSTLRSHRY
jgi:hypothetical protein